MALPEDKRRRLREIWVPQVGDFFLIEDNVLCVFNSYDKEGCYPLPDITMMHEILLREHDLVVTESNGEGSLIIVGDESRYEDDNLCDALWASLVDVL